jgi:hypothetical protein
MNNYKRYMTLAPGESFFNGAIVKAGTMGIIVDDEYVSKELSSTYLTDINSKKEWAKERGAILLYCIEDGFFFRIQKVNLYEL